MTSNLLPERWLGSVEGRVPSPTMIVANMEGDARRSTEVQGCCSPGVSAGPFLTNDSVVETLVSSFCVSSVTEDLRLAARLPNRPSFNADRPPAFATGRGSLPGPDNLSSNDKDPGFCSSSVCDGVVFSFPFFSLSFFLRAAAKAASLDGFPSLWGFPPIRPSRGYKGSMRISARRCGGMFNQGESRKKSAAEKWADDDGGDGEIAG